MIFKKMTRKEQYDAYQDTARRLYETTGSNIYVPRDSDVKPMYDGAYVAAVIWIPKEELECES
jgi:hypothetical protein